MFELKRRSREGQPLWAYRYRLSGRGSRRVQRGGFASEQDAAAALERDLERVRRERRIPRSLTLAELIETYLAQHDVQRVTIEKLRWLLSKATALAAGIDPLRRVYDLRHTFATFALRAGISTFDLSRYMGVSLTMIDRHYGHLARDGRDHAINLLDSYSQPDEADVHQVDVAWTLQQQAVASPANRKRR